MTEKEKMLSGELYNPMDKELLKKRNRAIRLSETYNRTPSYRIYRREALIRKLFPNAKEGLHVETGVHADYGENVYIGKNGFFNYNFIVLDCAPVHIGDNFMAGPGVQIVPPVHPLVAVERRVQEYKDGIHDLEYALPIEIGNDVWLATGVIVCGGAKIGDGAVIGAGSVVLGEIPPNTFAAGVPAKPIRPITDADRMMK